MRFYSVLFTNTLFWQVSPVNLKNLFPVAGRALLVKKKKKKKKKKVCIIIV